MTRTKNTSSNQDKNQDPFVIGIGASAGGMQALDQLFSNVPRDSVAYVIVQHLSPEHKSLLQEVLSKHTAVHFREAQKNMPVEINNVYIIPPGKQLTIRNNCLQLTDRTADNISDRTINTFFKSLAADKGHKAIGIILSGTGTDGTEGILAIKGVKGLVIVQDPETAKFDGMPRSAINTGYVDYILPPELMPDEIFNYVKVTPITDILSELVDANEPSFFNILELIRERTGVDFSYYKRPTIIRRISRRMAIINATSLIDYLDYLHLHTDEVDTLSKEFLIGVTKFFRDPEAFEIIGRQVIPTIIEGKTISDQLRLWVGGCSSGEEAYSLAILIREYLDTIKKELEVKIFASDIDRDSLDFASKALYPESSLADMSEERRNNFFVKEEGKYRVVQRIRRMVIYSPHNVINDPPFSKIDLVSCRNMLIYLSPLLQKKVITKFHYSLNLGGYLFLGSSESLGDLKSFAEVNKKWKIFRNTEASRPLGMESFINPGIRRSTSNEIAPTVVRPPQPKPQGHHNLAEILNETILEEYQYAAVYVDENFDLIHGFGNYTKYLTLPNHKFTLNLLKLVPEDLALNISTLLRKASRDKEKVTATGIQMRENDTVRHINVIIKPYLSDNKLLQKFILVLFSEDSNPELAATEPQELWHGTHNEMRLREVEVELQQAREDLQSVVEELETANEELQSTNEELLSSNEELQSTNEELQSLNEELHTINSEHQYKIKMLMELDDDLNNYFRSTNISQIFVDRNLIIRKFTPAATEQINLIDDDIGRSINQISHNLGYQNFTEDIEEVISKRTTKEQEIQDKNGIWYQMRIIPYLTQENRIDGAIIIFIQVNELKNLHLLQQGILNSSPNAVLALRAVRNTLHVIVDFECTLLNTKAEAFLGIEAKNLLHQSVGKQCPSLLQHGLFEQYKQVVETGELINEERYQEVYKDKYQWVHLVAVQLNDGLVLNLQDITERKNAEAQLLQHQEEIKQSSERFRLLLEALPHITWTASPTGEALSFNQKWYNYTELTPEESMGWGWRKCLHPDDVDETMIKYKKALASVSIFTTQYRLLCASDGQYRWHLVKGIPMQNEQREIHSWIGTATDIHDQKLAEENNIKLRLKQQKDILTAILQTQEAERNRISEALHNGLGQILYAAKLHLTDINTANTEPTDSKNRIEGFLDEAIKATRNISFELTPNILKDFGLKTAISELLRRVETPNLKIKLNISGFEERPGYIIEISLYRIIQELINNILKHSGATEANIELVQEASYINLRIQDNGTGLNKRKAMAKKGLGLSSIRNRLELLEGTMDISSKQNRGTAIEIFIPHNVQSLQS